MIQDIDAKLNSELSWQKQHSKIRTVIHCSIWERNCNVLHLEHVLYFGEKWCN